jgi:hypothetical protein
MSERLKTHIYIKLTCRSYIHHRLGYGTVTNRNKSIFLQSNTLMYDKPKYGIWVIFDMIRMAYVPFIRG